MEEKTRKYYTLFKQKSLFQILSSKQVHEQLVYALTEDEIDELLDLNLTFIRNFSPSSKIDLTSVQVDGIMTLINIEGVIIKKLLPEEITAILLHEIGHALNPEVSGIEGEFIADNFAAEKGYAKWIVNGLKKGLKNKWLGFNKDEIELRINNLTAN